MGWWERWNRWLERRALALDTASAALFAVVSMLTAWATTVDRGWAAMVWSVLVVVPLAWRRARPVGSVVAVYTVGLLHTVLGFPLLIPADAAVLIALYSVTVYGPRWAHRTAITGALVGSVVLAASMMALTGPDLGGFLGVTLFAAVTALAVWAAGLVKRSRRETLLAWRDRAERLQVERDQQARIATAAERARIAREMHDIVAHSLSVVIAQADGGRYAAQADPAAAARSLGTIAETGRSALADMRRLLGVLREGTDDLPRDGGTTAAVPTLAPQPAGGDVEQLVDQVRSTGVRVSLVRVGTPRALPPGAGLTVFRICQESLTNVLKHAGPDPTVTVLLRWAPASLTLEVSDDGRGAAATDDGAGHGLVGMRERAAMFGGTVSAGPRPGGGFRVRAELPLPAEA